MTPSISSVRSRGSAHVLIPAAVALVALIATAIGVSEPSMAPPPPPPGPGDTVVIHGPRTYNAPIGSPNTIQNFVDTIPVVMHAYNRYVVRVKNGNTDGTQRVLRAVVGTDSITGSIAIKTFEIAAKPTTTVNVSIRGQATAGHLTVELLEIYGGNFAIFGAEQFSRTNTNSDVVFTRTFTRGANAGPPFHLWIVNGNSNGSQRLSGVIVKLNADTVVGPPPKPTLTTSTAMLQVQVSPVSGSNTLVITLPKKQSGFINLAVMATDITRPTLTVTAPAQNFITRFDTVVARGTVTDQSPVRVTVNGALATITGNNFSRVVTLPEGHVVLTFSAVDAAGNRTDTTRNGISDRTSPVWEVLAPPPNGFITNQTSIAISGTASDNLTGVTVYVDDSVVQAPSGTFSVTMPLVEGLNTFGVSALDGAGNGGNIAQLLMGTRDTQRPTLTVSAPANGATVSTPTVTVQGTASDAMLKDVKVNGVATTVTNGAFSKVVDLAVGQNTIVVIATDSATNADTVTRTVTRTGGLPPDPATVATAIDPTVPTTIATSTAFLYSGSNPIQTGVAPGTIEPVLAAVVRGKVLTGDGQPLPGVTVTVLGHPEFGQTLSRADGGYDLALNGGGQLTLSYTLNGYIGAQRQSTVPWQDFVVMDDVRLLARDPAVTAIAFTQPIEVARGSAVSDARGARRTTMLFAQGTTATMVRSDNSTQVLPNLHVRATEFTVGPKGPEAMPAPLPPTSAYTWAADLNADEAVAANAKAILFDKPVVVYLENFLDFPVGLPVPLGIYDQEKAAWNPIPNGRVIQIVDAPGGVARIALDGSGQPASDAALTAMGITTAERTSLASLYASGQELWRMTTTHFSWIDGNWPWGPDTTRQGPDQSQAGGAGSQGDPCEQTGSIIECENQVLGERVPLVGSSSALNYRSVGVPGHIAPRQMTVPLTDSVLPAGLRQVFLDIELAGRRFHYEFTVAAGTLTTNLKQTFRWDGKDAYDRTVNGAQPTHVTIAYRYPGLYAIPADEAASFGLTCFGPIENPSFLQCQLPALPNPDMFLTDKKQEYVVALGELTPNNIGGWTLDRMHSYDPYVRTLYLGNGVRQTAGSVNSVIQTVAGNGTSGGGGDGGPAT
ncbi:MAG TPA: hypothetical protein VN803_15110, partial [Gemmatimonadales bacterium]|nr:hypothetical protein [Gemmatimonadales bacterium]